MPRKKKETPEVQAAEKPVVPYAYGVWYVMRRDFSGWELYRRTKETIARSFPHPEQPGRVIYNVWGAGTAGGATTCDQKQFIDNIVRVATEEDAVLPPAEPFA